MDTRHDLIKKKTQITINTTRNHDECNEINVKIDINCFYYYWFTSSSSLSRAAAISLLWSISNSFDLIISILLKLISAFEFVCLSLSSWHLRAGSEISKQIWAISRVDEPAIPAQNTRLLKRIFEVSWLFAFSSTICHEIKRWGTRRLSGSW